jgi:uncharacterized protein
VGALALAALLAALPVPPLTGPVVDVAGLLDARAERALVELATSARAAQGGQGVQLQYLLVRSLEGEPIEDFSIRVAEAWKIGSKGQDNGVLVVVALEERSVRIEVGGGIEGGLTDLQAGRIIRNTIAPAFRAGAYGQGLHDAGVQILSALGALPQGTARPRPAPGRIGASSIVIGLFLLVMLFRILGALGPRRSFMGRGRRGGGWWIGGPPFGGGGGFGGFGGGGGGGGWGGGGGGFSGGGASGRW